MYSLRRVCISLSKEGFEVLNHSTAHLLAAAVQELYPQAKFGIGPAIDEGFYYDIDFEDATISDADLPIIEKKMKELAARNDKIVWATYSKEEALEIF